MSHPIAPAGSAPRLRPEAIVDPRHDSGYRRGYHQAYEAAILHVRQGRTLDEMCEHGDRIQRWREMGQGRQPGAPPSFGQPDPAAWEG